MLDATADRGIVSVALRSLNDLMDSNSRGQFMEVEAVAHARVWRLLFCDIDEAVKPLNTTTFNPEQMSLLFRSAQDAVGRPERNAWRQIIAGNKANTDK